MLFFASGVVLRYAGDIAYQRGGPTFTFSGFDLLRRTATLFPDLEDRAALIRKPRPARRSIGGTLSMSLSEFALERPERRLS